MKATRNEQKLPPFCPACDAEGDIWKRRAKTMDRVFRGETFHVKGRVTECERCGFGLMRDLDSEEAVRATLNAYRKKHRLLMPEEIIARRKALGLAQAGFAKRLQAGVASVKRWENGGVVQDKSSDLLIRRMTEESGSPSEVDVIDRLILGSAKAPDREVREEIIRRLKDMSWTAPARTRAFTFVVSDQPFHTDVEVEFGSKPKSGIHVQPPKGDLPRTRFEETQVGPANRVGFELARRGSTKKGKAKEDVLAATA